MRLNVVSIKRIKAGIQHKWMSLGRFNRALIMSSGVLLVSCIITVFLFIHHLLDERNVKCLAMNVYHEARGEPTLGQYAVAVVTMNRVNSTRYPSDVCQVVYQKSWVEDKHRYISAFSWTTDDAGDIPVESEAWDKALTIAKEVYDENGPATVKEAMYYHADTVKPSWARNKLKIKKIGHHIFYR